MSALPCFVSNVHLSAFDQNLAAGMSKNFQIRWKNKWSNKLNNLQKLHFPLWILRIILKPSVKEHIPFVLDTNLYDKFAKYVHVRVYSYVYMQSLI